MSRPSAANQWWWGLRVAALRLRRSWGSSELRVLALAVGVAVTAATSVSLFSERMRGALAAHSGEILGADLVVSGRESLPRTLIQTATELGLRSTTHLTFPSLARRGELSTLVSVKAVAPGYPLRGSLRLADDPFGTDREVTGGPASGEAWVDAKLWNELNLITGAQLALGALRLSVTGVLTQEPDRGGGFFDLAPRVMINQADVAASGLVAAGSRVQHTLMLAGSPQAISQVRSTSLPHGLNWVSPDEARPEIRNAIRRASQFLDIAVLAVAVLAAAAIGLTAQQQAQRVREEVALLKCLGAQRLPIALGLGLSVLGLGAIASVAGLLLGYAGQSVLALAFAGLFEHIPLPAPRLWALLPPLGLGMVMLLGMAMPPLLDATRVPPMQVLQQRSASSPMSAVVWGVALATGAFMLLLQTGELALAGRVLGGALITALGLALVAWALVASLQPMRRLLGQQGRSGFGWRLGIGNIARRRNGAVVLMVALGLGLLSLLLVSVVRNDVIQEWRQKLPEGTPNIFLINIQPNQRAALQAFFTDHGYGPLTLWPMVRARLVAMNGKPVSAEQFADEQTRRWINRDFNLSWTDRLGDDNRITDGAWWGEHGQGRPWLSVETYAVKRLGLKLGDRLTLSFAGQPIELIVHHIREVEWDSFRPNFFLLTPPGVIDQIHAQWITSFYLSPEQRTVLRDLLAQFPNLTPIDMDTAINQVRSIMTRIIRAVEYMLLFTLAAGVVVLLAAIEGTRNERRREVALLRALGAGRRRLAQALLVEFAVLGLLAGLVAALAAQGLAWTLATQVLDIPSFGFRPLLWLIGAAAGAALVAIMGWLSVRSVLSVPPRQILQSG